MTELNSMARLKNSGNIVESQCGRGKLKKKKNWINYQIRKKIRREIMKQESKRNTEDWKLYKN